MTERIVCRLCGGDAHLLFEKTILRNRDAGFHQCGSCGLTQTSEPTWLAEAYRDAIHATDTGLLARNLGARQRIASFLHLSGIRGEPCLDYAGGYGVFVRLMRDVGFDFYWRDPYAKNLLSPDWEWTGERGRPVAVTALEVLEHFVRPLDEFRKIAELGADYIVTRTEIHSGVRPDPDWPYLSVESGQHVSFYRADTLRCLGGKVGYPIVIAGGAFQVFARAPFPRWRWNLASKFCAFLFPVVRRLRPSFTDSDCEQVRRRLREPPGAGAEQ